MNKILYVILNGKEYGGSEKHVVDIINNLSDCFEVSLVMSEGNDMSKYINKNKCKTIYYLNRDKLNSILTLKKIINKEKPDIIHAHAARALFMTRIAAKKYVKKNNKRLICTAHGWILNYLKFSRIKEKMFLLNRNIDYKTLAVSNYSMNEMIDKGYSKDKMSYIYNGIDIKSYNDSAIIKKNVKNINYIGRFTDQKGIDYLLEALTYFKDSEINFRIYGKGEKEELIKDFIKKNDLKNVQLKGYIPADEVINVLHDTDVLLLPSIDEGFPYILVEAVASGVPCIATDVGGVSEIINNENGIIIKPKKVDLIIDAINEMINTDIEKKSKKCIEESIKFDISTMISNIEKIYRGE